MKERLPNLAKGRLTRLLLLFALIFAWVAEASSQTFTEWKNTGSKSISEAGEYYYDVTSSRNRSAAFYYSAGDELHVYSDEAMTQEVDLTVFKDTPMKSGGNKSITYVYLLKQTHYYLKFIASGSTKLEWGTASTSFPCLQIDKTYTYATPLTSHYFWYQSDFDGYIVEKVQLPEGVTDATVKDNIKAFEYAKASASTGTLISTVEIEQTGNVITAKIPVENGKYYQINGNWSVVPADAEYIPFTFTFSKQSADAKTITPLTLESDNAIAAAGDYYYSFVTTKDGLVTVVCGKDDKVTIYSDENLSTEVSASEQDNGDGTKSYVFTGTANTTYYVSLSATAATSVKVTEKTAVKEVSFAPIVLDSTYTAAAAGDYYYSFTPTKNKGFYIIECSATDEFEVYTDSTMLEKADYQVFTGADGKTYVAFKDNTQATYYVHHTASAGATIKVTMTGFWNTVSTVLPIEMNKEYTAPGGLMMTYRYSFIPKTSGICYLNRQGGTSLSVDGETLQLPNATGIIGGSINQRYFEVTAGKKYTMRIENMNSADCTFKVLMESDMPIDTVSVNMPQNSVYSITGTGQLTVTFNRGVTNSGATLTCGNYSAPLTQLETANTTSISYQLKTVIYDLVNEGICKSGDTFTVTIKGIASVNDATQLYGTDGTLTLTYIMPAVPMSKVSEVKPEKFLSYWAPGDADGVMTLTFNQNINTEKAPVATLMYGNVDDDANGQYYNGTVPLTVDGKTITIDLTGVSRTHKDLLPNQATDTLYTTIALKVSNICDSLGTLCYTGNTATTGSFTYSFPYEEVKSELELAAEFTPISGEYIVNTDTINVAVLGSDYLTYDGALFTYSSEEADTVSNDKIVKSAKDDFGYVTLGIPVPTKAKTASNVKLSLANLTCTDGMDHSAIFSATYNPVMEVTMLQPQASKLDSLKTGDTIKVTTNVNDKIPFLVVQIRDLNATSADDEYIETEHLLELAPATDTEDSYFWFERFGDVALLEGHTYSFEFTAYATKADRDRHRNSIGNDTITIEGASKPYEYSPINFVSIDPSPDTLIIDSKDQRVFNIEFDGKVTINSDLAFVVDGSGSTSPLESIVATDEGATADTKYSKKWQLTVSEATMETVVDNLPLSVAAEDEQGRRVKGNEGKEAGSYFSFGYEATVGVPDFIVTPADGSTVAKLDTIVVEFLGSGSIEGGIDRSYNVGNAKVIVYDKDGNEVAHVKDTYNYIPDDKMNDFEYVSTKMYIYLDNTIKTAGDYTLVVPKGYLILGTGFYNYNNKATTLHYTVNDGSATELVKNLAPIAVSPDTTSTSKVQQLSTITLTYDENVVINPNIDGQITVVSKTDRSVVTTASAAVNADDSTKVIITLADAITAEGNYTVVVPEGMIGNKDYEASSYTLGRCNVEYALDYGVGEPAPVAGLEADPAPGNVTSLKRIVLTFTNYSVVGPTYDSSVGSIELRDATGAKVVGATSDIDWTIEEQNKIPVDLDSEVTAEGKYTLHIPAGFYVLGEMYDEYSPEINLVYTIGGGEVTAVEVASIGALRDVEDGAAVKLTLADAQAIIASGVYGNSDCYVSDNTGAILFSEELTSALTEGGLANKTSLNGVLYATYVASNDDGMPALDLADATANSEISYAAITGDIVPTEISVADANKAENLSKYVTIKDVATEGDIYMFTATKDGASVDVVDMYGVLSEDFTVTESAKSITGFVRTDGNSYTIYLYTVDGSGSVTTGINGVNVDVKSGKYYNLNGQRVTTPGKGLYIKDGKKVILK